MNRIATFFLIIIFLQSLVYQAYTQDKTRWEMVEDGAIEWKVIPGDSHMDHIEMSGLQLSAIVHYGLNEGVLNQRVHLVFPMLRTIPNDTHASLAKDIAYRDLGQISINGRVVEERPYRFRIKGMLLFKSKTEQGVEIHHQLFPSTDKAVFIDKIEVFNTSETSVEVDIPVTEYNFETKAEEGVYGAYKVLVRSLGHGKYILEKGESLEYSLIYSGMKSGEEYHYVSPDYEHGKRQVLVDKTLSNLVFECPDPIINRTFAFAKIRAVESIYDTKGGLMHGPGGGRYYAAIWANDQAEYANPFFPFLGNLAGNESSLNSFRHFARYMNVDYKPIPSSIIAEGTDYWNGAGDRGDMAMIAYGAGRFAMALGDKNKAHELWPLITWCLEYCRRMINEDGVVRSDSDELEGRFPAGDANLNTSCLYYDALISAVYLGIELDIDDQLLDSYSAQAFALKKAIEDHFGYTIAGYDTYRYYEGNEILRAWICTPLTVGIYDRAEGSIEALFSDKLWTEDGLASVTGSTTFWDRATLYALRGVFAAGSTEQALHFLEKYSKRRLLGDHVPYPVEAYPEGNQRHLSAESALFCRIITEGIFGIRPNGLSSFLLSPNLPDDWEHMTLRNVRAFGQCFDISVRREDKFLAYKVFNDDKVIKEGKIEKNAMVEISF